MRLYCFNRMLLRELISFFLLKTDAENSFDSVKIISLKNANCVLALRKRLFCNAKPTLLPCKRAAFGMQNNRFCNALIASLLCNRNSCENCLRFYGLLSSIKWVIPTEISTASPLFSLCFIPTQWLRVALKKCRSKRGSRLLLY